MFLVSVIINYGLQYQMLFLDLGICYMLPRFYLDYLLVHQKVVVQH